MTTILGEHISTVRPSLDHKCQVYKDERPKARYRIRCKMNKGNSGRVVAVCVMLKDGGIRSMPTPATHTMVVEHLVDNIDNVVKSGWELENGNFVWR